MRKFSVAARLLAVVMLTSANAGEVPVPNLVEFGYGATYVDLTNDSVPDLVVLGHRENFNAHSFDVASFYVLAGGKGEKQWNIVPIIENRKERFEVLVSGGADCVLHDFRLLSGPDKDSASLIIADRDSGTSFVDSRAVTFTYYLLRHNLEGSAGVPLYSFRRSGVAMTKATYCDVGEAFRKELGLGYSGLRREGVNKNDVPAGRLPAH